MVSAQTALSGEAPREVARTVMSRSVMKPTSRFASQTCFLIGIGQVI
jgi:hypothetical protein